MQCFCRGQKKLGVCLLWVLRNPNLVTALKQSAKQKTTRKFYLSTLIEMNLGLTDSSKDQMDLVNIIKSAE